jgi:hypothetical protein
MATCRVVSNDALLDDTLGGKHQGAAPEVREGVCWPLGWGKQKSKS